MTPGGYRAIAKPDHPRADASTGYVLEHIVIVEAVLGKPFCEPHEVHHVNGKGADNRHANLVACEDHAYHMLLHRRQRALRESGNVNWLRCLHCKKFDDPQALVTIGGKAGERSYHKACAYAYYRQRNKPQSQRGPYRRKRD